MLQKIDGNAIDEPGRAIPAGRALSYVTEVFQAHCYQALHNQRLKNKPV